MNYAIERDLDNAFKDYDNGKYDAFEDITKIVSYEDLEINPNYFRMNNEDFALNKEFLLRKGINEKKVKINEVVKIIFITDKCILFEFSNEWLESSDKLKGKKFWIPKSLIYKRKTHKSVLYIPKWFKIKFIN